MEKTRKRRSTGRVTLQEVANFAGVGTMTVSRALRTPEQVSDKLREKIEQAVEELGYIPNRTAGALASGHSNTVAVLIPSLTDKASSSFMQSLQQVLNKNEFQLLLGCHEHNQHKEAEILMTLLQSNPAALVIFGSQLAEKTHQILEKVDIPTINVVGSPFSQVDITLEASFFEAAHKLTDHLLNQGYKHIGFIGAHMDNRLQRQELNGWHKAMLSRYQNSDQIITTPEAASLQFGRYALTEMLLRQPELDAVICSHEEIALGIMFECQRRLLKIPGNIAIACLDGSDSCDQTHPTLTSVRIDYKKMGKEAGKLLIELLNEERDEDEPRIELFSYQIELRQST
ncbi:LacI family transcriptional regulator [Enterobacteriaceae bacterium H20N1]|uniref:LacI family transcriptional regulator n=1 Tax=Dryocola boscaweniae TaxID=2925397 RepID=A0A9X2W4A7_9ENTR|nr:LacI family DNA-binding transcriptional regulator [Dryocola boscaweniae]MCT4700614.1 LacI family transcriptional regulator [Dryocola boscaweniae]MCT4717782.1 LacI family transcriptional regulator [Dryocola boscaweniae]